jgi:hypothetical protein
MALLFYYCFPIAFPLLSHGFPRSAKICLHPTPPNTLNVALLEEHLRLTMKHRHRKDKRRKRHHTTTTTTTNNTAAATSGLLHHGQVYRPICPSPRDARSGKVLTLHRNGTVHARMRPTVPGIHSSLDYG